MCAHHEITSKESRSYTQFWILAAIVLGVIMGFFPLPGQEKWALTFMTFFTSALKLISLPIIFLALLTSFTGIKSLQSFQKLSSRTIIWTLLTTLIAATVALILYLIINPAKVAMDHPVAPAPELKANFLDHLIHSFPQNLFQPFLEGNVFGILILAIALGIGLLTAPGKDKIHEVLSPLLSAMMRLVKILLSILPIMVWSGIVISFNSLIDGIVLEKLGFYLLVVIGANLIQGFIVLPLLLKAKGIAPFASLKKFFPALTVAFFSKSSVATMPIAIRTSEESLNVRSDVSRFVFPICTTINMNGCAAFILATGLFVSESHGIHFSFIEMVGWIFIASIAAVGNAGVPMGCFFLATALLASMNVPVEMMGLILPFYSIIDMIETALNVWSDASVAMIVNKESPQETFVLEKDSV